MLFWKIKSVVDKSVNLILYYDSLRKLYMEIATGVSININIIFLDSNCKNEDSYYKIIKENYK